MYLTRFRINPARRGAQKLLGSPHAMHAAVRASFAEESHHQDGSSRTLWRVDALSPTVNLYVVSPGKPDLTHLVEQAGWPTTGTWDTRDYEPLLATLQQGQRWAFRLTANPVHSGRIKPDSPQTQRFGLLREPEQVHWLISRAHRGGFAVCTQPDGEPNISVHQRQTLTFKRGSGSVTLVTATFEGVLEIADPQAFRHILIAGIGHGKAYGCGLLTLAQA